MKQGFAERAFRLYFRAVGEPENALRFLFKSLPAQKKKTGSFEPVFLVRVAGLEPVQPCGHKNLNLTRLPVPPHPLICLWGKDFPFGLYYHSTKRTLCQGV